MSNRNFSSLARLETFAGKRGHTVAELAIAWLLSRSAVSTVIAGATKSQQLLENLRATKWHLSASEVAEVDQMTQTHLGIGDETEESTKIICPWCSQQTLVSVPENAFVTSVRRADSFPAPEPSDPSLSLEMCHSCIASFYLSQQFSN